ncbi:MAG: NAD(P)/FAD-dependent oxidoreductase [Candidatus Kapaibacterium sp.]
MKNKFHIAIIGAGPAGIAAAIQLQRAGADYAAFEGASIGGLIRNANLIENYPGFPAGTSGRRFAQLLENHADNLGLNIIYKEIKKVKFQKNEFELVTDKNSCFSDYLIVASGTQPIKDHGITIDPDCTGRVFYEVADLPEIGDCDVCIIGSGDAAYDYALGLAKNNSVKILMRSERPKCLPLLYKRALRTESISVLNRITARSTTTRGEKILLNCSKGSNFVGFDCDYLLIAIGRRPRMDFLEIDTIELNNNKRFILAGDVHRGKYRQTAIAAGDGLRAAMEILDKMQI